MALGRKKNARHHRVNVVVLALTAILCSMVATANAESRHLSTSRARSLAFGLIDYEKCTSNGPIAEARTREVIRAALGANPPDARNLPTSDSMILGVFEQSLREGRRRDAARTTRMARTPEQRDRDCSRTRAVKSLQVQHDNVLFESGLSICAFNRRFPRLVPITPSSGSASYAAQVRRGIC